MTMTTTAMDSPHRERPPSRSQVVRRRQWLVFALGRGCVTPSRSDSPSSSSTAGQRSRRHRAQASPPGPCSRRRTMRRTACPCSTSAVRAAAGQRAARSASVSAQDRIPAGCDLVLRPPLHSPPIRGSGGQTRTPAACLWPLSGWGRPARGRCGRTTTRARTAASRTRRRGPIPSPRPSRLQSRRRPPPSNGLDLPWQASRQHHPPPQRPA